MIVEKVWRQVLTRDGSMSEELAIEIPGKTNEDAVLAPVSLKKVRRLTDITISFSFAGTNDKPDKQ